MEEIMRLQREALANETEEERRAKIKLLGDDGFY